jgi:hypothetical protein
MTPFEARTATPVSPLRLLVAAAASFVLAVLSAFALAGAFGSDNLVIVGLGGLLGRAFFIAAVVLIVLAAVRKLDRR